MSFDARTRRGRMQDVRRASARASERAADYLASERGRKLRQRLAAAMILSAPVVFRVPVLKRYPVVRLIELLGGAAALVELARMIREWEPVRAGELEPAVAAIVPFASNGHSGRTGTGADSAGGARSG